MTRPLSPSPVALPRFLTFSFLAHLTFLGSLFFAGLKGGSKHYTVVDFVGGLPSGGAASPAAPAAPKEEIKTRIINPKEDLLLKAKKKEKNVKEVITESPPIPSLPIPEAPKAGAPVSEAPAVPGAVPGTGAGSGVGIGFGPGSGTGSGAGNFPYAWYVQTIKKKLDSNWMVTGGFSNRIYTQVAFTIRRDGLIGGVEVEESSKNDVFDRAAVRAVESSGPFPPLPSDFPESELRVHVRFAVKR